MLTFFVMSEYLRDPIDGYSGSLLHGKWVIGRLNFDVRTDPVVSQMRARLEIFRTRIEGQLGRQPAKEWTDVRSFRCVEAGHELIEAILAERNPDSLRE